MDNIYNPVIFFDPAFAKDTFISTGLYVSGLIFGGRIYLMILPAVIVYYLLLVPIKYFKRKK